MKTNKKMNKKNEQEVKNLQEREKSVFFEDLDFSADFRGGFYSKLEPPS